MPDAWYLPAADGAPDAGQVGSAWHEGLTAGGLPFRTPALDVQAATELAAAVRDAALAARRTRSIEQVTQAIDRVAQRLAAGPDADEAVDTLASSLGWPPELASETLSEARSGWTLDAIGRLLDAELPDRRVLDGFAPDVGEPARARHASGPPLLFQVLAANVPGVAVTAIVRGLLARSGVLCKTSRDEPFLPALFARLLAEEDAVLGATLAVSWWPFEAETAEWSAWSGSADLVVAYGGGEAIAGMRSALPAGTELLVYGPRVGVGAVLGGADYEQSADRLARDVCAYEQQGCVSPRLVFVVDGDVRAFGEKLAGSLDEHTRRRPPPKLSDADATAIRALRAEREFDGAGDSELLASDPDLRWTILLDPEPTIEGTNLPRVVHLSAAPSVGDLLTALEPLVGHIQAVGYAGEEGVEELAQGAAVLGVSRVAPFGRIAWPPVDWRHDGRQQLMPLLRWTDWERE